MQKLAIALTAASLLGMAVAAPAEAQMRGSTQARQPAAAAGPTLGGMFRPTFLEAPIVDIQRAQTLMPGVAVANISTNAVGFTYGMGENLETGLGANVNLAGIGGTFQGSLGLNASGKYTFVTADNLGVAGFGQLGISMPAGTSQLQTSAALALPVSFWIGQRGGFHVMPGVTLTPTTTGSTTTFGVGLGYEMELSPKWRVFITDNLAFGTTTTNNYQVGVRVGVTEETTVDVSLLNGTLNLNPVGGAANVTLVNLTAYFGGRNVRGAFGL